MGPLDRREVKDVDLDTDIKVGSLATLPTTAKNSVVAALAEAFNRAASVAKAAGGLIDAIVTPAALHSDIAGSGLVGAAGEPLAVNTDGTSIDINGNAVRVKPGGLNATHFSDKIEITKNFFGVFEFPDDYASGSVPATYTERGAGSGITRVLGTGTVAIQGGRYFLTKAGTPLWGSPGFHSETTIPKWPGMAFAQRVNIATAGDAIIAGWKANTTFLNDTTGATVHGINIYNGGRRVYADGGVIDTGGTSILNNNRTFLTIHTIDDRVLYLLEDEVLYLSSSTLPADDLYAVNIDNAANYSTDWFRVNQLPKPFSDTTIYTVLDETPSDGDTYTASSGDVYIKIPWTPDTGETLKVEFRRKDALNSLYLLFSQTLQQISFNRTTEIYDTVAETYTQVQDVQLNTAGQTFVVGTEYTIDIKMVDRILRVTVNKVVKASSWSSGFGLNNTGVRVSGFTDMGTLIIMPAILTGQAREVLKVFCDPQESRPSATVFVPSQEYLTANAQTIDTYVQLLKPRDTLELSPGDHYTLTGTTENGFANMPSGCPWGNTTLRFNGATVSGGSVTIFLQAKRWFTIEGAGQLLDGWNHCIRLEDCRNFSIISHHYLASNVHPGASNGFVDPTRFFRCRDFYLAEFEIGPSIGQNSMDGLEFFGGNSRCKGERLKIHGMVANGIETWSSELEGEGRNEDITLIDIETYNNGRYGISVEGSDKFQPTTIVAVNLNSHGNGVGDAEAIQGQTLILRGKATVPASGAIIINETTPPELEPDPDGHVIVDY